MKLTILLEDEPRDINVAEDIIASATPLIQKMDADMDNGWTLGRDFIAEPSILQRCQIAADRLLTGLHTENQATILLMTTYILARLEDVQTVVINTEGEMAETLFYNSDNAMIS
jgi:hypothetical protein